MKKFLICLSILFSFLFIGNVKAVSINGVILDDNFFNRVWSEFLETSTRHQVDYPYVLCDMYTSGKNIQCYFFKDIPTYQDSSAYSILVKPVNWVVAKVNYNKNTNTFSNYSSTNIYIQKQSGRSATNFDVYNGSTKVWTKTIVYNPSSKHNISFHLNGGTAFDTSNSLSPVLHEEDYSLEMKGTNLYSYLENLNLMKNKATFLGWYYDSNFTQPYNNSDTISSDIDLYAKWETPKTFNFHLNGGYLYDPSDGWGSEEDFSISLYNSEIEQFFTNLEVKKASMLFDGWFYDNNYKNIFHINDNFTEETYNLYAKWRYEKVDDFLSNTTFNEYTFDTMYDYAIITKGDKLGDIYLGLNLNKYEITVYEYNENLSNYEKEKGFCLVPIYSKNGTYYYNLDTSSTSYTEVLVLPKTVFENNNYSFLLTDNAYITYTNNLEDTVIYDSNGNQINTNLEDTYQTFQDSMISDEHDLLTIFKNLTKFKDNNVFNNINTIWNKFKRTDLYTYFMILIVGGLIILIIKGAKRS